MPPMNQADLYPWNLPEFVTNPFRFGYLGVNLFFAISGFVITQSIDSSKSFSTFWARRFSRIWPSLVFISFTFYLIGLIANTKSNPGIDISLPALISSIMVIDPRVLTVILPAFGSATWITGVLWSLWVEVNFYLLISILVYLVRVKKNIVFFFIFSLIFGLNFVDYFYPSFFTEWPALDAMTIMRKYIFWFYLGFIACRKMNGFLVNNSWILICILCNLVVENSRDSIGGFTSHLIVSITIIILHLLFIPTILNLKMTNVFSQLLAKLGDISYEVYLTHEFALLMIITTPILSQIGNFSLLVLFPYIMGIFFLSYKIKSKISDPLSRRIRNRFS